MGGCPTPLLLIEDDSPAGSQDHRLAARWKDRRALQDGRCLQVREVSGKLLEQQGNRTVEGSVLVYGRVGGGDRVEGREHNSHGS